MILVNPVILYFCPLCRKPAVTSLTCPNCHILCDAEAETYLEKLLEAVLSPDPTRVGMAIDVLTQWMHEERAVVLLLALLNAPSDAHRLVMAARGLGELGNPMALPALIDLLQDVNHPFVARAAAAQALGKLGGYQARQALQRAVSDIRPSISSVALHAIDELDKS